MANGTITRVTQLRLQKLLLIETGPLAALVAFLTLCWKIGSKACSPWSPVFALGECRRPPEPDCRMQVISASLAAAQLDHRIME